MTTMMLSCKSCYETWGVESAPDGRGYLRSELLRVVPSMAAHLRDVHQDEEAALAMERWAVTPPPQPKGWIPE